MPHSKLSLSDIGGVVRYFVQNQYYSLYSKRDIEYSFIVKGYVDSIILQSTFDPDNGFYDNQLSTLPSLKPA